MSPKNTIEHIKSEQDIDIHYEDIKTHIKVENIKESKTDLLNSNGSDVQYWDNKEIKIEEIDIYYEDIKEEKGRESEHNRNIDNPLGLLAPNRYKFEQTECSPSTASYTNENGNPFSGTTADIDTLSTEEATFQNNETGDESENYNDSKNSSTLTGKISSDESSQTSKNRFSCKFCSKLFGHTSTLKIHQRKFHSSSKKPSEYEISQKLYCAICSKFFYPKSYLKGHMRTYSKNNPFNCNLCKQSFICDIDLITRERTDTVLNEEEKCHCEICSTTLLYKSSLKNHLRIHSEVKPFKCKFCEKSFFRGSNLRCHERTHTGEKPFACKLCGKFFAQKCTLMVHERIHSNKKNYLCELCKKSFSTSDTLKMHKKIHTGERAFKCKFCTKSFIQKGNMKIHEKNHSKKKSFRCKICEKDFLLESQLKRHVTIHTLIVNFAKNHLQQTGL